MSDNVGSSGIMVPLTKKMSDEEREEITEEIWDSGNDLVQIQFNVLHQWTNKDRELYNG